MNFFEFIKQFPTEIACIEYFIKMRYSDKVSCNHCKSYKVSHRKNMPKVFRCNECKQDFSIFKGTIFEKSDTDLRKWFYAIHLLLNSKKGISGYLLQREITVTYKCAWRMLKLIREAMGNTDNKKLLGSIVEVDEAYVCKEDNNNSKKRGRGTNKEVIVSCLDRENKQVKAKVMTKNKDSSKLSGNQLLNVVKSFVESKATIITDEFKGYNCLDKEHKHLKVNHSKGYVGSEGQHINNVETFFSTLKRGIVGIYHHVSSKYLQNYIDEFCFRYSNRSGEMFNLLIKQTILD